LIRTPSTHVNQHLMLGPLEIQVMEVVWTFGESSVRDVVEKLESKLAYTTVMTTLDRLYKKRLLERVAEGRAFRYSPRHTREELKKAAAEETIRELLSSSPGASLPLSYLVEAVSEHDVALLDELQHLLDRKRRERSREKR
jgi:predicted transcriptional regulator